MLLLKKRKTFPVNVSCHRLFIVSLTLPKLQCTQTDSQTVARQHSAAGLSFIYKDVSNITADNVYRANIRRSEDAYASYTVHILKCEHSVNKSLSGISVMQPVSICSVVLAETKTFPLGICQGLSPASVTSSTKRNRLNSTYLFILGYLKKKKM